MTYVYDILLNFNEKLFEFFEWEDTDNIKYAKKIVLFKIRKNVMYDFLKFNIEFSEEFIKDTLKYEMDGVGDKISYALFTDGALVLGVSIKNNKIDLLSRLIIDEEDEVIEQVEKLSYLNINYKRLEKRNDLNRIITRDEEKLRDELKNEFEFLHFKKNKEKLSYLYYEFTGKENNDINYTYNFLINSLKSINEKHLELFKILRLSNKKI